jgi:hypothetical protein
VGPGRQDKEEDCYGYPEGATDCQEPQCDHQGVEPRRGGRIAGGPLLPLAFRHRHRFARSRIVQLGGVPFQKLSEAEKLSFGRVPRLPKSSSDWKRMVKDALQLEQGAITFYNQLLDDVHGDAVTQHLVREALEDEVKDEHELASLLE